MKKNLLFTLIVPIILGSCSGNKPAETTVLGMWTDYYLMPVTFKGKVKEVKELNYWAVEKDGKITKGNLMTSKDLDSIGSIPNLAAYFDDKGNLIRYERLNGDVVTLSSAGTYDNGRIVRLDAQMKDSSVYYTIPEYDKSGLLIGAKSSRPLVDTLISKVSFTYDSKGILTGLNYFDYKNQRTGHHLCSVDENGNFNEVKYFNKNDSLTYVSKSINKPNGNMTRQESIDVRKNSTTIWDIKYLKSDGHGNEIECYSVVDNGKYKILAERSIIYY